MSASTKRTFSVTACLCLALSVLTVTTAVPAQAQSPQPTQAGQQLPDPLAQADEAFQAAKAQLAAQGHTPQGRLTSCTSFTRVNTMTDPVAAKAAADKFITDATTDGSSSTDSNSPSSMTTIKPDARIAHIELREIPIAETVTDPVTFTITPDGGVRIEGSGTIAPSEKRRAQFYEINLARCTIAARYASADEQAQSDTEREEKERAAVGLGQPTTQEGGYSSRSLTLTTKDFIRIPTAQTTQYLWWGWGDYGWLSFAGGSNYCYPYNPTLAGTHWYLSWCSNSPPQTYYSSYATVSNSAAYWNRDFFLCSQTPWETNAFHYLSVTGYAGGWYNYYWHGYQSGSGCADYLYYEVNFG